jgi:hypothetical protein
VADGFVLDTAQFGGADFSLVQFLARLDQVFRPQQIAHMVGAERGFERLAVRLDETAVLDAVMNAPPLDLPHGRTRRSA